MRAAEMTIFELDDKGAIRLSDDWRDCYRARDVLLFRKMSA